MSWIVILLIWVLAPFAELGIIIRLCVSNSRYKRQIQELSRIGNRHIIPGSMQVQGGGFQQEHWTQAGTGQGQPMGAEAQNPWQMAPPKMRDSSETQMEWSGQSQVRLSERSESSERSQTQRSEMLESSETQMGSSEQSQTQVPEMPESSGLQMRPIEQSQTQAPEMPESSRLQMEPIEQSQTQVPEMPEASRLQMGPSEQSQAQRPEMWESPKTQMELSKRFQGQQPEMWESPEAESELSELSQAQVPEAKQHWKGDSQSELTYPQEMAWQEKAPERPGWQSAPEMSVKEPYPEQSSQPQPQASQFQPSNPRSPQPQSFQPQPSRSYPTEERRSLSGGLGTIALILGVIFIVLAGLIFATTSWHVLGDVSKTLLVMACAAVFFGASFMADKIFGIRKTSNAFYILGSAFLFLTVLAAAYFKLLGPEFILDRENRWKVLWVGSLVMEASFFAGIKRFNDRIYTQASLWGMSVSMFFLAKAFSIRWSGFVSIMMIYAAALMIFNEYLGSFSQKGEDTLTGLLAQGLSLFAPIHFWFFGAITGFRGFIAESRMLAEGCMADYSGFLDRFSIFSFTLPGAAAMAALAGGIYILGKRKQTSVYSWLLRVAVVEMVLYGAGGISSDFIWRMLAVNLSFMVLHIAWDRDSLLWDICGCTALAVTLLNFYNDRHGTWEGLVLCLFAFVGYYFWFYRGNRQWPHLLAAVAFLPFPLAAEYRLGLTFDQVGIGVGAVILVFAVAARCFYPIIEEDRTVQGGWRMDWFQILSVLVILYMMAAGNDMWRFIYLLAGAVYVLQYTVEACLKKPALSLSAVFLAAAFWQQPFAQWPQIIALEVTLLPVAGLTWVLGLIWERNQWIRVMQTVIYMICLVLLCQDAFFSGLVADALMLEGVCLAVFVWAQIKNNVLWVRVSGALILVVVLFMTRDFWLSISWWVYLLAAGIGLIVFAAVIEKKRR